MNKGLEILYQEIKNTYDEVKRLYDYLIQNSQDSSHQGYRIWGQMCAYEDCLMRIKKSMQITSKIKE